MTIILDADFTSDIKVSKILKKEKQITESIKISQDASIAEVTVRVNLLSMPGYDEFYADPDEVIFRGRCSIFRQLEEYYMKKGAKIIWQ